VHELVFLQVQLPSVENSEASCISHRSSTSPWVLVAMVGFQDVVQAWLRQVYVRTAGF
jgi:hypothetical protein